MNNFVFPLRRQEGQKKTAYKAKTLNPVFNEIFSFQLEQSCIAETKLRVAIWDHDFFGEDDFNGEAVVDLSKINLNTGTHTDWFMLQLEVYFNFFLFILNCVVFIIVCTCSLIGYLLLSPWSERE